MLYHFRLNDTPATQNLAQICSKLVWVHLRCCLPSFEATLCPLPLPPLLASGKGLASGSGEAVAAAARRPRTRRRRRPGRADRPAMSASAGRLNCRKGTWVDGGKGWELRKGRRGRTTDNRESALRSSSSRRGEAMLRKPADLAGGRGGDGHKHPLSRFPAEPSRPAPPPIASSHSATRAFKSRSSCMVYLLRTDVWCTSVAVQLRKTWSSGETSTKQSQIGVT